MNCNSKDGCKHTIINCPKNALCTINALVRKCSRDLVVNVPADSSLDFVDSAFDATTYLKITGNANSVLNIRCSGEYACDRAKITGGTDSEINVVCSGRNSCEDIVVDATEAALLTYQCTGGGSYTCRNKRIIGTIDCLYCINLVFDIFET